MKKIRKFALGAVAAVVLLGLVSCADMSKRDSMVVGAGAGAVGGAILTNGSPAGVVGGAIVGGVIGHQVGGGYSTRYPADRYYYNPADGRYYRRHYRSSHTKARCNDGAVVRASRNACISHGGVQYYW